MKPKSSLLEDFKRMAAAVPSQLVFELEPLHAWGEADFYVAECNANAFALIKHWDAWHSPAAVVYGPAGSGKSHLARIWQTAADAKIMAASQVRREAPQARTLNLVIEDVDGAPFDETALFHELNLAREHGTSILLTGRTPPGQWALNLPDLRSRVRSYPAQAIHAPDDELLAAVLLKHFSDRQLSVTPDLIPYLLTRMERSMEAAQRLAAFIDKSALAQRRKVTRAFAAKLLS
jgi:chromosomal replication initiation ATPase DnaA